MLRASNLTRAVKMRIPLFSNDQAPEKALDGSGQNSAKSDNEFEETFASR